MLLNLLILNGIELFNEERSLSAVFHLLSGRISVQTKQDAQLFKLSHLYNTCPFLTSSLFERRVSLLENNGSITLQKNDTQTVASLSDKGREGLEKLRQTPINYFTKNYHGNEREVFLKRIYLFTQTIANTGSGNYHFIPVVDCFKTKVWVRHFHQSIKGEKNDYLILYYNELKQVLGEIAEEEAEILVDRLTGFNSIGLSVRQLAQNYHRSICDIHITLLAISERLMHIIKANSTNYSILRKLIPQVSKQKNISASAQVTLRLLKNHHLPEDIAISRNLQLNTIHDHIVEIALANKQFSIRPYVSVELEQHIKELTNTLETKRLKEIKQALQDEAVDYFQIRLALTRI